MTLIPIRVWLLLSLLIFTYGCASPETKTEYTIRTCVIALIGQTEAGHVAANLVCEPEKPYAE